MDIPAPVESDRHSELVHHIENALDSWCRFLIGVDGVEGAGKSTLARYLAWRLGLPAVATDLFLVPGQQKSGGAEWLQYRLPELKAVLHARLDRNKPVIVEGVCLLHTLAEIGLSPDYLVYIEQEGHDGGIAFESMRTRYSEQYSPLTRAHEVFKWQTPLDT